MLPHGLLCMPCCPRIYAVQESIHDAFAEALTERVRRMKLGEGLAPGVTLGPLITQRAVEGVRRRRGQGAEAWEKGPACQPYGLPTPSTWS